MRFAFPHLLLLPLFCSAGCIETKATQSPYTRDFGLAANLEHGARLNLDTNWSTSFGRPPSSPEP